MQLRKIISKKGAIELSIGTVVVIVIGMTMLILGLVLVRNIFSFGTDSVDTLSEGVKGEITSIFTEEGTKIAIRLGSDKTARVKQGERIGVAFGARAESGEASTSNLKYTFELMDNTDTACRNQFKKAFLDYGFSSGFETSPPSSFEDIDGAKGFSIVVFDIPDTAKACEQRVRIKLTDSSQTPSTNHAATFRVKVQSSGIFS